MSGTEYREIARRWLATARDDLDAAQVLLASGKFSHACFLCQQSAEKAVKAVWFDFGDDPWGHSVQKLLSEAGQHHAELQFVDLMEPAAILDRFYITTRYPDGLPDLTPQQAFFKSDAALACTHAQRILAVMETVLANR